jgi:hypothetical protein
MTGWSGDLSRCERVHHKAKISSLVVVPYPKVVARTELEMKAMEEGSC